MMGGFKQKLQLIYPRKGRF